MLGYVVRDCDRVVKKQLKIKFLPWIKLEFKQKMWFPNAATCEVMVYETGKLKEMN